MIERRLCLDPNLIERVFYLALRRQSGDLTASEFNELEEMLLKNSSVRHLYAHFNYESITLAAALVESSQEELAVDGGRSVGEVNPTESRTAILRSATLMWLQRASRRPVSPAIGLAAVAVALLLIALAVTPLSTFLADNSNKPASENSSDQWGEEIATLSGWHRVDWEPSHRPTNRTNRIRAGQKLAFLSGIIEITYDTEAKVVIEGPAEFTVGVRSKNTAEESTEQSRQIAAFNSGFLTMGKLVARVEGATAKHFTIETPTTRVEDLSTEFGLNVGETGDTTVTVFDGVVIVAPDAQKSGAFELTAGKSVAVTADGPRATEAAVAVPNFVRHMPSRDTPGVASFEGDIRVLRSAPSSVEFGAIESSKEISMFRERDNITLPQDIPVSITEPGIYRQFSHNAAVVPAGTNVDSYYFSLDVAGEPRHHIRLVGSVTFDRPILGLICLEAPLLSTNSILGSGSTTYPDKWHSVDESDAVILSRDRRTLRLKWSAARSAGDQMRVLVESRPESPIGGDARPPR